MKNLADYQDAHGFIGHKDDAGFLEFGDGAQRLGMYHFFRYLRMPGDATKKIRAEEFLARYNELFLISGEPVRHWNHYVDWYAKPGTMSRDQLFPLVCALSVMGFKKELAALAWKLIKRGGFAWNSKHIGQQGEGWKVPDWCGPLFWLTVIRGLLLPTSWWAILLGILFYIPLTLCDLLLIPTTMVRVIVPIFDWDNVGDDLNHFCLHLLNHSVWPTLTSYVCFVFYMFRPQAGPPGSPMRQDGTLGIVQAFRWYFFGDKNPPLDEEMLQTFRKVV